MDGARLSRYPHLLWPRFGIDGTDAPRRMEVDLNGSCHTLGLVRQGRHAVRWMTRGLERAWISETGNVHFLPVDDAHHTFVTEHAGPFRFETLILPRGHFRSILASEHHEPPPEWHRLLAPSDAILRDCMIRVCDAGAGTGLDQSADEAARRLVLRLAQLCGGRMPDWHDDQSVFTRGTLSRLVALLDEHLSSAPSTAEMALLVGMSPSHFARKFRRSTGLSLHRFTNRRRIRQPLDLLRHDGTPLAILSARLGFSSQSHFTRLFSALTGMTPARYRRRFEPTIG